MNIGDPLSLILYSRSDKQGFLVNGIPFHFFRRFTRIANRQRQMYDSNKRLKPNQFNLYLISYQCNLIIKSTASLISRLMLHYDYFQNRLVRYKFKDNFLLTSAEVEHQILFQKCLARANELKISEEVQSKYQKYNFQETIALYKKSFVLKKDQAQSQIEEFINQISATLIENIKINSLKDNLPMLTKEKLLQHGIMRIKYAIETKVKFAFQSVLAYSLAHRQQQKYLSSMIIQHIYQTCERNRTVRADLAHFLVPYAILLRMLQVANPFYQCPYINQNIFYILQRMEKPFVKYQLQPTILNSYFEAITHSKTYEQLHSYLRMFMMIEYELMSAAVPYYYNFFALVINQQVYFRNSKQELLEYTVPFSNPTIERNLVRWEDIHSAISMLERALVEKYHSNDI